MWEYSAEPLPGVGSYVLDMSESSKTDNRGDDGVFESLKATFPFIGEDGVGGDGDAVDADISGEGVVDDVAETHKEYIAPDSLTEHERHVETDHHLVRCFYVDAWPQYVREFFFEELVKIPDVDIDISLNMDPKSTAKSEKLLNDKKVKLETDSISNQKSGNSSFDDTEKKLNRVAQYYDQVSQSGKILYDVSCYLTIRVPADAPDPEEDLRGRARHVISMIDRYVGMSTKLAHTRQRPVMEATSPIANDTFGKKQIMLADQAATMFPFISEGFLEPGGIKLGNVAGSESPVILDPFNRANGYNQLRLGKVGSGKSFAVKQNLIRIAQSDPEVDVIVVDPMRGFIGVNEALAGDNWISIGGDDTINPLEIEETPQHILETTSTDPWKNKLNDVRWFFEQFAALRNTTLSNGEWSVLMRAVKNAYKNRGITQDPETHSNESPVIGDIISEVEQIIKAPGEHTPAETEQSKEDRKQYASEVEMFLEVFREDGEYANMNGHTDLELTTSRMTYLDLHDMSARSGGENIMMQVLFSMIYQRVKQSDRKTILAIDEAHKLFGSETSLEFLEEVTRHSRHYDLSIMYISQTIDEFFVNESAKAIADQCSVKYIHRLPNLGYETGRELLNFNRKEVNFIRDAEPGDSETNYSQALLKVDDMDAGTPLNIRATRDEMAIIDYEPGETWDELTHPRSDRIRRALDQKLLSRKGKDIGDNSLAEAVKEMYADDTDTDDADDNGDPEQDVDGDSEEIDGGEEHE